jgi:hypothetical protein
VHDKKDTPIYSARDEDSEAREEISNFVVGLAERVDLLQDVEGRGNLDPLRALARPLATDAARFGFDLLATLAQQVVDACEKDTPDAAAEGMTELTEIARRVRLGHRGAA